MNIDRRGFLVASSSALVLGKSGLLDGAPGQPPESSESPDHGRGGRRIEGGPIAVYTTADNTNLRLSATDTLAFKHAE